MATRPQTRQRQAPPLPRDQIPPPPSRLPGYAPLPPPTSLGPEGEAQEPQEGAAPLNWPYAPPMTIADEQRARSLEIQAMGATAYMAQFDTRTAEEMSQTVAGVGNTQVTEGELRRR